MYVNDLSFDPAHLWLPVPGLGGALWAVEVFTTEGVYGLDPESTSFDGQTLHVTGLQFLGGQRRAAGRVDGTVRVEDGGAVTWLLSAQTEWTVKAIKLLLRELPHGLDGDGWWNPAMPAGTTAGPAPGEPVLFSYPWHNWQTPWLCAGEGPGLALSVRDTLVRSKRFYCYTPHWAPGPVVEIVCDELATRRSPHFVAPPIRVRRCESRAAIRAEFERHLAWLEGAFDLVPWERRDDVPAWADEVDLVLTLHGQHWTGYVFNTFDQMASNLETVAADLPGGRILAYLPGWEGRYYWQYPSYGPGADLGGEPGFERLVATARRLGVHLMPMFGANGANVNRYPDWERAAFRSPSNRYVTLVNTPDWDNDRLGEDEQVFLNPGEPGFRRHLVDQVSAVVERFGIEGVFLDTSACWFNDPRYDVYDGYRLLVGELHRRHPGLLVCGEGWYDALLALFPMNQTWLEMAAPPYFDDLPMRYTRVLGHLKDGAPGNGSTGVHEAGTNPLARPLRVNGFAPALPVVDDTISEHREAVSDFVRAVLADREAVEEPT
jgi:hypothetical protein